MTGFVVEHRDVCGVEPICRVLQISPSTYYSHAAREDDPEARPNRWWRDRALEVEVRRVWNWLDPEAFLGLLTEDVHYASQYVFEELEPRDAITKYLRAKMRTVKNFAVNAPESQVRTEIGYLRGRPCVFMAQGSEDNISAVAVFEVQADHAATIFASRRSWAADTAACIRFESLRCLHSTPITSAARTAPAMSALSRTTRPPSR